MNREIKFRGFSLGSKKWVYGFYYSTVFSEEFKKEFKVKQDSAHYIYQGHIDENTVEVDPETVGQYTGLKDKNGVEIYEGDIVRCWDDCIVEEWSQYHIGEIVYNGSCFTLKIEECFLNNFYNAENTEVIGNIHENP